ncbi:MAG: sulfate permease [Opitutales bacterium]
MRYFRPKLADSIKGYNFSTFLSDLGAGISVGIIALPLAMAFAIASGVSPEQGIITAVIAGFLISAFGGSKVQIGGPTGAFIMIVLGIVAEYGLAGLMVSTFMAGVILLIMGFAKMGSVIKYIPRPVTIGFTNGIALAIMATQIKDFFGFTYATSPSGFVDTLTTSASSLSTISWTATAISVFSVLFLIFYPKKWASKVPASIVVIILATLACLIFGLNAETIGDKFGEIKSALPTFSMLDFGAVDIKELIMPAFTIAILAAIESLLSAVVADGLTEEKHDSNQELVGQGIANVIVPFFGGIPATGAIARTAANIKNGGKTPIAGIIHAVVLLLILLVVGPYVKFIPLPALAAILFVVAYNMGQWSEFSMIPRLPRSDTVVFLATFLLTLIFGLTVAVEVGMVLAAMLFIRRISETTEVSILNTDVEHESFVDNLEGKDVPQEVMIFRVFGVLMFGAADKLENIIGRLAQRPKIIIIRMRTVLAMDATALDVLDRIRVKLNAQGIELVISGAHDQPYEMMKKSKFLDKIGHDHVFRSIDLALDRAREILNKQG